MPFVKLDCGMLTSTLWFERDAREVFITALLMAEPREFLAPTPQLHVDNLNETGWMVPAGWYGFVPAAGKGIIHYARVELEAGMAALALLGAPEETSRSPEFDGRRLVRIDGGYLVLNYMKYRERDYTSAIRSKRYRERVASRRDNTPSHRDITQAEAEAEVQEEERTSPLPPSPSRRPSAPPALEVGFDEFWQRYPRKIGKGAARKAWLKIKPSAELEDRIASAIDRQTQSEQWNKDYGQFIPHPATWLNQARWDDEPVAFPVPSQPLPAVDWWDECKRLHHGECDGDRMRHHLRIQTERFKAGTA